MRDQGPQTTPSAKRRPAPITFPWAVSLHLTPGPSLAEGAGVVISPRQVLTCRHVVDRGATDLVSSGCIQTHEPLPSPASPSFSRPPIAWWVICHQHQPSYYLVRVDGITFPDNEEIDLALLHLVHEVPSSVAPAPLNPLTAQAVVDDGWWAFGHPDGDPIGGTARGVVGASLGYNHLKLESDHRDGEGLTRGFSGAGLWSIERRAVVGIVVHHGHDGGGRALALSHLQEYFPEATVGSADSPQSAVLSTKRRGVTLGLPTLSADMPHAGSIVGSIPRRASPWRDRVDLIGRLDVAHQGHHGTSVVCLTGPSGAGKSQLAADYCRILASQRDFVVLWAKAENTVGLVSAFAELGRRLGLRHRDPNMLARETVAILSSTAIRLLIVFDNARDLGQIEPYIPTDGECRVLITAREDAGDFDAIGEVIHVPGFDIGTSVDLLTAEAGLSPDVAHRLAASMGGLAFGLALCVKGVTNREGNKDVGGLFSEQGGLTLGPSMTGEENFLLTALERPDSSLLGDHSTSRQSWLLDEILKAAVAAANSSVFGARSLLTALSVLDPAGCSDQVALEVSDVGTRFSNVVVALEAAALLVRSNDDSLMIHTRVRSILMADLSGLDKARVGVSRRLLELAKGLPSGRSAQLQGELERHSRALVGDLGPDSSQDAIGAVSALACEVMGLLQRSGQGGGQVTLAQLLLTRLLPIVGEGHPDTLAACNGLAAGYRALGRAGEALGVDEGTLALREEVLGAAHPDALTSRSNLAADLRAIGRPQEALDLDRHTLVQRERVLGPDHPDTLTSRNNLAVSFRAVGHLGESARLFRQTLAQRERVLGSEHPDTLKSRSNLAATYWSSAHYEVAVDLFEWTLVVRERVLGPDHPDTLKSRRNLATGYQAVRRYADALALGERTLKLCEQILGLDHPETLKQRNDLASYYRDCGRPKDAISLDRNTLAGRERILGRMHPDTLTSRSNLAVDYWLTGSFEMAIRLDERTLMMREKVLGPQHPDTLTSRSNLAVGYWSMGDFEEAIRLDERTLMMREKVLGPEHPDTLTSRSNLAVVYRRMGRYEEAVTLDERTLSLRERVLGPEHPDTRKSRRFLAIGRRAAGRE